MAPIARPLRVASIAAAAASLVAVARPAFVAVRSLAAPLTSQASGRSAVSGLEQPAAAAQPICSGVVAGTWAAAACLATVAARRPARAARRAAEEKKEEMKEPTEPFDVFKPDTYGNITMDDVKKYGTAGTLSYVLTELAFWAIAFPTEVAIFYQTAGRWPDFSNDLDKATVLGFVFAASNIARLLLPLRFGAALALAPWVDENIIKKLPGQGEQQAESS